MVRYTKGISIVKGIVIFILLFSASGCYTIRTIPVNNLYGLTKTRTIARIHADDSLWIINNFRVESRVLSGSIYKYYNELPKSNIVDIYVAPLEAVKVEGGTLSLPSSNIGKIDYPVIEPLKTFGFGGLIFLFLVSMIGTMGY